MKTSLLIKRLQELDETVPFDADIVTGGDWMPADLVKVYHEPPHTFLEFEGQEVEETTPSAIGPDRVLLSKILDAFRSGLMTKELALNSIVEACSEES